jgi:CubicO group peptidase (beta-lactamase class C family)
MRHAMDRPTGWFTWATRAQLVAAFTLVALSRALSAQASGGTATSQSERRASLAEYEGVFAYHGTATIALVATDTMLYAVLDDAKYPLRFLGADRFLNGGGDTIPFRKTATGTVSGFVERGVFFPRRTPVVDSAIAEIVRAVPRTASAEPYRYSVPAALGDGIRTGDAPAAGLDSAMIERLVSRVVDRTYPDVHAILVHRGGKLVLEEYFYNHDRDRRHQMRSLTKSVVSAVAGLAVDRGLLREDERVLARMPYERYANPDPRKDAITLRDLLTMQSGLACDDWDGGSPGNESKLYQSSDWVKFVLDLPMQDAPGTRGRYCSGNVKVIVRMVERATGTPFVTFAQRHLFTPLGIEADDLRWNYALDASNAATFGQVYLRPRDMLKLGLLVHQQGQWAGRQLLSREWVARSTAAHATVGDQRYGYLWWHQWVDARMPEGPRRVDMIVATGNGGQKIYIVPSLDLIVVMTGGSYNTSSPSMTIMAREILPAMLAASR